MLRLFANANYDFIAVRRYAYARDRRCSSLPGLLFLLVHGLNYSIEFTGGTLIQIQSKKPVDVGAAPVRARPRRASTAPRSRTSARPTSS